MNSPFEVDTGGCTGCLSSPLFPDCGGRSGVFHVIFVL